MCRCSRSSKGQRRLLHHPWCKICRRTGTSCSQTIYRSASQAQVRPSQWPGEVDQHQVHSLEWFPAYTDGQAGRSLPERVAHLEDVVQGSSSQFWPVFEPGEYEMEDFRWIDTSRLRRMRHSSASGRRFIGPMLGYIAVCRLSPDRAPKASLLSSSLVVDKSASTCDSYSVLGAKTNGCH